MTTRDTSPRQKLNRVPIEDEVYIAMVHDLKSGKTIKFYFPNITPTKEKYTDYEVK